MMNIYSMRDGDANAYMALISLPSDAVAVRALYSTIERDPNLRKYPTGYALFQLGEWDEVSGVIKPLPSPRRVLSVTEAIAQMDRANG